jgi:hypothetical protein
VTGFGSTGVLSGVALLDLVHSLDTGAKLVDFAGVCVSASDGLPQYGPPQTCSPLWVIISSVACAANEVTCLAVMLLR